MNANKLMALAAICVMAALPLYADTNITEYVKLTEDADWSSLGTVNIAADAGIHLNGHNLTVSGFAGDGSIYSSVLPAEYAELEYVETDNGQYIDTGVAPSSSSSSVKVDADVAYMGSNVTSAYVPLVASANNDNRTNVGLWLSPVSSTIKWSVCNPDNWFKSGAAIGQGQRSHVIATWERNYESLAIDGGDVVRNNSKKSQGVSNTMYLPAKNKGGIAGEKGHFKIYSLKLYRPQTTLVRDYVPAKRLSDDVAGFYDRVSGTFFPSATETAFVEGPEVGRGGGELRINVAEGTFLNSTVAISNSVKVVKLGAGMYTSSKYQTYSGGTDVNEGRISFAVAQSTAEYCAFGTWGTDINVAAGAQIVVNAEYQTLNGYKVTIAGDGPDGNGAIYGNASGRRTGWNFSYLGSLSLSGDASIKIVASDAFNLNSNRGTIDIALNGHTLTAGGSARFIVWSANVVDEGRIVSAISPGSDGVNNCFYTHGNGVHAPLVDFEVAQGGAIGGEQPMTVSNLVMRGTFYPYQNNNANAYTVTVLDRYSPKSTSGGWPRVALGDVEHLSPTLDLSDLASAYDGTTRGVSFLPGSTVTVYAGAREIAVGDKLVSWNAAPDISVGFSLAGDGWTAEEREIALAARGDGLYVKTTAAPAYATLDVTNDAWLFFAADGTPYSEEWTDGVTADMQVRFASYDEYAAVKAKGVTPSMFVMTAFAMSEGIGEVDLTEGMEFQFDEGIVIDVKGNSLKLPAGMACGEKSFTVTSSVEGGEVVVDIAGGTSRNTSMTLSGSLKLTKKGAGTFVSALSQTYTDGTDVEAGTVRPPDSPADNNYTYSGDNFAAFGTGIVNVLPGAAFDVRGNYAYTNVVLKGGTIANTLRSMTQTAKPGVFVASLADADTSYFNMYFGGDASKYSTIYGKAGLATDLGGKTLEITVWNNLSLRSALTNGTIVANEKTGWFQFDAALDMRDTTFVCNGALQVNANLEIGEYVQRGNTTYILGNGKISVHRRFTPEAETYFHGCTMLDGAVLDISKRETPFTAQCRNWQNTLYSVEFPAGGSVGVEVGGRDIQDGEMLVAWDAMPEVPPKFTLLRSGEACRGWALRAKEDGLYVVNAGMTIIVR